MIISDIKYMDLWGAMGTVVRDYNKIDRRNKKKMIIIGTNAFYCLQGEDERKFDEVAKKSPLPVSKIRIKSKAMWSG